MKRMENRERKWGGEERKNLQHRAGIKGKIKAKDSGEQSHRTGEKGGECG